LSARTIAGRIDRPSSTVSREIARNGGRDAYRALFVDAAAFERARRPKPSKLAANPGLRGLVTAADRPVAAAGVLRSRGDADLSRIDLS
jgi:IS30 family transposase